MKLKLKETICHILQRLDLISDWVVEQGTSGIWTYRKWNSGIAECWGRTSYKVTSNSAWGNLYEGLPGKYENYPNGLFIETPNLTVSNDYAGYTTCGSEFYIGHSASRTPTIYGLRPSDSSVNLNVAFNMYARGLWKSLGGVLRNPVIATLTAIFTSLLFGGDVDEGQYKEAAGEGAGKVERYADGHGKDVSSHNEHHADLWGLPVERRHHAKRMDSSAVLTYLWEQFNNNSWSRNIQQYTINGLLFEIRTRNHNPRHIYESITISERRWAA